MSATNAETIGTSESDDDARWTLQPSDPESTQLAYLDRCDFLREFEERVNSEGQLDRNDPYVRSELAAHLGQLRVNAAAGDEQVPTIRLAPEIEAQIAELEAIKPPTIDEVLTDWAEQDLNVLGRGKPQPPVIRGLLYASTNHLIFGPFSASKTMLAAWCAQEVIEDGGNVVWLDVDGGHPTDLRERLESFGLSEQQLAKPADGGHLIYLRPESKLGEQRSKVIAEFCREHDVRLVVIDSAIGTFSLEALDPDKAQDVNDWWQHVGDKLKGHRAAVLMIAHSGLSQEAQGRAAHSQRFATLPGSVYQLKTIESLRRGETGRDAVGTTSVIVKKDRPSYHRVPLNSAVGTLTITSHCIRDAGTDDDGNATDGEWTLSAAMRPPTSSATNAEGDSTWRPTTNMERCSRTAEQMTGEMTRNSIKSITKGKSEHLSAAIEYLIRDGHLRDLKPGTRGSKLELIRPYRAPKDEPRADLYEDDE